MLLLKVVYHDLTKHLKCGMTKRVGKDRKNNLNTENSISNHVKSNQIRIVIALIRQIKHQTEFRLVLNLQEECNHNTNLI